MSRNQQVPQYYYQQHQLAPPNTYTVMYTNGIYQQQPLQQTPQAHYQANPYYQTNPYQTNPYPRHGAVHQQHSVTPVEAPTVKPTTAKRSDDDKVFVGCWLASMLCCLPCLCGAT